MRFEIKKNLLDIEERTNRSYYTALIIIALTATSIIIALLTWHVTEPYHLFLYFLFGIPAWLLFKAFECESRANAAVEKIRKLN